MPRKRTQFKNLGTLPSGEWRLIQHVDGAIIAAASGYPPRLISNGKMQKLSSDAFQEQNDAKKES